MRQRGSERGAAVERVRASGLEMPPQPPNAAGASSIVRQTNVNPYRRPWVIWRSVMRMSLSSSPVCGCGAFPAPVEQGAGRRHTGRLMAPGSGDDIEMLTTTIAVVPRVLH